jgi:glycosyltransferase involved in cell wall biosynthesis
LVIKNGVTKLSQPQAPNLALPRQPYFVFLGAHDVHKNIEVVLEALKFAPEFSLACVGDRDSVGEALADLPGDVAGRVSIFGFLSDAETAYVIANSTGLVCPSLYEGFGLPALEAALLDVPAICSDRPAMNELLHDAALFCPVDDVAAWVGAMRWVSENRALRLELVRRARLAAAALTWERAAAEFGEVFAKWPN